MPYYNGWQRTPSHPSLSVAYYPTGHAGRSRVFAHEVGHIYGLPDEYKAGLGHTCHNENSCGDRFGYLQEPNGNCKVCDSVPCVMSEPIANVLCPHTVVHLGWRDSDGDGVCDPRDPETWKWASIFPLSLGDRVAIFDIGGTMQTVFNVTEQNLAEGMVTCVWDCKTTEYLNAPMGVYKALINNSTLVNIYNHWAYPPIAPYFENVGLVRDSLRWTLENNWSFVTCKIFDEWNREIARPIWDEHYPTNNPAYIDLQFLPYQRTFRALFSARLIEGGLLYEHSYNFVHTCQWLVGDANGDGAVSIADANYLIAYIFCQPTCGPAPTPHPIGSGDADCNGAISIADAVYLINYIFAGGLPPGQNCVCEDYY